MPVDSLALKCISTIDHNAQGHSLSLKYMLQLAELAPNVIQLDEKNTFEMEVLTFHHSDIPPFSKEDQRIDEWWNLLRDAYPVLSKIVFAILSCFHEPQVESAFSIMQDILDPQSSRLRTETLSAIQTVKYTLRASNKSAVGYFKRSDVAYDQVDKKLSLNMRTSAKRYHERLQMERIATEEKKKVAAVRAMNVISKRKANQLSLLAAKRAKKEHYRSRLAQLAKIRKLSKAK